MATITGQRARSTLPAADTPNTANRCPGKVAGLPAADLAATAWRSVVPSIACTPHVRVSRDGGRTLRRKGNGERDQESEPFAHFRTCGTETEGF